MSNPKFTWNEVEDKLKNILVELLGAEKENITLSTNLRTDLEADSLDIVEIIMSIEDTFGIEISDEVAIKIDPPTLANGIKAFVNDNPREVLGMVDTKVLSFRLSPDGKLIAALQLEDGSWTYADGQTLLPSMLCVFTYSKWANILKDLEDLINDPKTKEDDLQKFFEEYPELVAGDDYDIVIPQATISHADVSSWEADFILAPVNQTEFTKVLELKMPDVSWTTKPKHGHVNFTAKVWSAINQLQDYARAFENPLIRERFQKKYNTDVYKPDMHLIVGRRWNFEWIDDLRQLRKSTPVKIEDWDSALERLKRRYK